MAEEEAPAWQPSTHKDVAQRYQKTEWGKMLMNPLKQELQDRAVNVDANSRMKALQMHVKEHDTESGGSSAPRPSLAVTPAQNACVRQTLRSRGCETVEKLVHGLTKESECFPLHDGTIGPRPESPPQFAARQIAGKVGAGGMAASRAAESVLEAQRRRLEEMNASITRHRMRGQMDRTLKRLMVDMELAKDDRQSDFSHKTRVDHLDKMYDWYDNHQLKEVPRHRAAPPYIVFTKDECVSPGSLRVLRSTRLAKGGGEHSMANSSSTPALFSQTS